MALHEVNFTKTEIEKLKPSSTTYYVKDNKTPNLFLRVNPKGRKTFAFVKKHRGTKLDLTLGIYGQIMPETARQACVKLQSQLALGQPLYLTEKQDTTDKITVKQMIDIYIDQYAKKQRSIEHIKCSLHTRLKDIHQIPVEELTVQKLNELHSTIEKKRGPSAATQTLIDFRTCWNWAIRNEITGVPDSNKVSKLHLRGSNKRERRLTPEELTRLFKALSETEQVYSDIIKVGIFCGARKCNLISMLWSEIDFEKKLWTIPGSKSKNKKEMNIVLADEVITILNRRKKLSKSGYVFETSKGRPLCIDVLQDKWTAIRRNANISSVWFHDLRRSFGSFQADNGASLIVISKSLGHLNTTSTPIYSRVADAPIVESVNRTVERMKQLEREALAKTE